MKNKKVVIMSIDGHETVAYTDEGEFIQVPKKKHHRVGQVLRASELKPNNRRSFRPWQIATAAAAILLIAFVGVFYPFSNHEAEAYLSVGFDSGGIEMWINDNDQVIDVRYHDDTKGWHTINLEGKDVYQAVTMLASKAQNTGLIDELDENLLMLNHCNLNKKAPHHLDEARLKESVSQGLDENQRYFMIMDGHDAKFVNQARKMGITASQYYVMERSNAKGHHLTAKQLKNHHVKDVLQDSGTTPEKIFDTKGHHFRPQDHQNNTNNLPPAQHPMHDNESPHHHREGMGRGHK